MPPRQFSQVALRLARPGAIDGRLRVALAAAWLVAFEAAILRFHYGEW